MKMNEKVKDILEWIICIIIAIVVALLVRFYIGTPTKVESISMEPTLFEGHRLWINRWNRTIKKMPKRGQIITFEAPSTTLENSRNTNFAGTPQSTSLIAEYKKEPQGLWEKFKYYVLEIGKVSYIKRVIGLPGDQIQIKDGYVYIKGERLQEDYLAPGIVTDLGQDGIFGELTVPENTVFVMGDNRPGSKDSRVFGCIPLEKIESTLGFRFWPLNLFGTID